MLPKHFLKYGCFYSTRFLSYRTLYPMENAWGSPSISHSIGKCSKTHPVGRLWDISTYTSLKIPVVLSVVIFHQISILWYTFYRMGNVLFFQSIFNSTGKCSKAHPEGENWNIDTHTVPKSMAIPFHEISILWCSTSHETCLDFPMNFS